MRNDFAHEYGPIDFADPRCASRLDILIPPSRVKKEEGEQLETLTGLASLAPTKEQLINRIAFAICMSRIIAAINGLTEVAKRNLDLRPVVREMEEQGLYVNPM
jgi:hypothetical protein